MLGEDDVEWQNVLLTFCGQSPRRDVSLGTCAVWELCGLRPNSFAVSAIGRQSCSKKEPGELPSQWGQFLPTNGFPTQPLELKLLGRKQPRFVRSCFGGTRLGLSTLLVPPQVPPQVHPKLSPVRLARSKFVDGQNPLHKLGSLVHVAWMLGL